VRKGLIGYSMTITINGEEYSQFKAGISVAELLTRLELPAHKIAVERNREIVSKSCFATTIIEAHDQFEIIHFIGGG
jgi:thiamine biosynthesis protein ThiS